MQWGKPFSPINIQVEWRNVQELKKIWSKIERRPAISTERREQNSSLSEVKLHLLKTNFLSKRLVFWVDVGFRKFIVDTWLEWCQELMRRVRVRQLPNELFYRRTNNFLKKPTKYFKICCSISCELLELQAWSSRTGKYHRWLWAESQHRAIAQSIPPPPVPQPPPDTFCSSREPRVQLAVKMRLTQVLSGSFELKSKCRCSSSGSSPTCRALLCGPFIMILLVEVVVSEKLSSLSSQLLNFSKVHHFRHLSSSLQWKLSKNINQTYPFGCLLI